MKKSKTMNDKKYERIKKLSTCDFVYEITKPVQNHLLVFMGLDFA